MKNTSKVPATLIEKYNAIQAIGTEVEVPYHVWSQMRPDSQRISIVGSDVSLGEDYATLEGARAAIEWYVQQLGGTVKWPGLGKK